MIATLGRLDELQEEGGLDSLLRSGARFSRTMAVLTAHERGEATQLNNRSIGPGLVFERLWKESGCQAAVEKLLRGRRFEFPVERVVFLTVLHRLFESGSDRQGAQWRRDRRIEGTDDVALHHSYRAMAWLGSELAEEEQKSRTPFAPRCVKDLVEEHLFYRRRDLFTDLSLVFFDTTTLSFEGEGGETLGRHGNSNDFRPHLKQMVVGAILDNAGRSAASFGRVIPLTSRRSCRSLTACAAAFPSGRSALLRIAA